MMKNEFEDLIHGSVTDEEYELIETVYMWHPAIRNTSGKEEVAELYKSFGIVIFYDMYPRAQKAKEIEEHIRLLFNFEFHRLMIENEELGRPLRNQDVVDNFIRRYSLKSISPDALLKNFYRYRQRLFPKTPRKYQKKRGI